MATTRAGIASSVRSTMEGCGFTQRQVAEHLGISQQGVSRRMCGTQSFTGEELVHVAELFGVRPGDLLDPISSRTTSKEGSR